MKNIIILLQCILIFISINFAQKKTFKILKKTNEIIKDIDGNIYHTVKIGKQVWMVENLKTTRYRNGDIIPNIIDRMNINIIKHKTYPDSDSSFINSITHYTHDSNNINSKSNQKSFTIPLDTSDASDVFDTVNVNVTWSEYFIGAYCNYENNSDNSKNYGRLYNWYAVNDSRGLAPKGWRIPSEQDWKRLLSFLKIDLNNEDEFEEIQKNNLKYFIMNESIKKNNNNFVKGFRGEFGKFYSDSFGFWSSSGNAYVDFVGGGGFRGAFGFQISDSLDSAYLHMCNESVGFYVRCVKR